MSVRGALMIHHCNNRKNVVHGTLLCARLEHIYARPTFSRELGPGAASSPCSY